MAASLVAGATQPAADEARVPSGEDATLAADVANGRLAAYGDSPTEPAPGVTVGDLPGLPIIDRALYSAGAQVAKGGMGRILSARDRRAGRQVAIKELLTSTPAAQARFEREARITARLQHPAIVPVYELGRWPNGEPFYAMKQVDGRSFDKAIAEATTLDRRLALIPAVLAVADAIAYAHDRRIIHRDVKPSNILVGAFGETVVIDWGLAKELGRVRVADEPEPEVDVHHEPSPLDDGLTVLGQAMGTPAYMPPEQARGDAVDERADVYALGAVLYHVLAGRAPYADASSAAGILERLAAGPPASLRAWAPNAPVDLLAIVDKAMARAPESRYADAGTLADDLRRFTTGQLVRAHSYTGRQRLARWLRRHRGIVAVSAIAIVLATIGAIVSVRRLKHERDAARRAAHAAEVARAETADRVDQLSLEQARSLLPTDATRALELARAVPVGSRWRRLAELTALVAQLWGTSTEIGYAEGLSALAAADDGSVIAWAAQDHVWVRRAAEVTDVALPANVSALAVARDGSALAAATSDGHVYFGARDARLELLAGTLDSAATELTFEAAPGLLVAGGDGFTVWWDLGTQPTRFVRPAAEPRAGRSGAADVVTFIRRGGAIELWSRSAERLIARLPTHHAEWTIQSGQVTDDGMQVVYWSAQNVLSRYDLRDGEVSQIGKLFGSKENGFLAWVGPVGGAIVAVDTAGQIHSWGGDRKNESTAYVRVRLPSRAFVSQVTAVGPRVALTAGNGDIVIVDPRSGGEQMLRGHRGTIIGLRSVVESGEPALLSAGLDGTVRMWRHVPAMVEVQVSGSARWVEILRSGLVVATGEQMIHAWMPGVGPPTEISWPYSINRAVSPDGRYLVVGNGEGAGALELIDLVQRHHPRWRLAGCDGRPTFAADAPRFACTRAFDGAITVWDTDTWTPIATHADGQPAGDLAISPDGGSIVAARRDVLHWEVATGRMSRWSASDVTLLASRAGRTDFVSAGHGGDLRLWHGGTAASLGREAADFTSLATTTTIVCAGERDGTIGIWDLERLRFTHLRPENEDLGGVYELTLSPDGSTVIARYDRERIFIWDVESGRGLPLPRDLRSLSLSADGHQVAFGTRRGVIARITLPVAARAATPPRGGQQWHTFDLEWKPAELASPREEPVIDEAAVQQMVAYQHLTRGNDRLREGRIGEAVTSLRRAIAFGDVDARWALVTVDAWNAEAPVRQRILDEGAARVAGRFPWRSRDALDYLVTSATATAQQKRVVLRAWLAAAGSDLDRWNELAYRALRAGTLDVAATIAERLVTTEEPNHLDTAAEVFHMRGDGVRAVEIQERAVRLAPSDESLADNLRRFRRGAAEPSFDVLAIQPPVIGPPVAPARIAIDE